MLFSGGELMKHRPANNNQPFQQLRQSAWLNLGRGILLALLFSAVLLLLIALLLYLTALPEKTAPYLVYAVGTIAILWGSSYAARKIGMRGWLNGGAVGALYVLLMLAAGLIVAEDLTVGWSLVVKIFLGFIFGAAGGMWGINY